MTVSEYARAAAYLLTQSGHADDDALRDVAVLIRHLLDWDTATWLTRQRDPLPGQVVPELDALIARRATGEPVAYLTGQKEFYGRTFRVTADVLVPRPDTELLVERACTLIDRRRADLPVMHVVDIGTGSGCIAVTIAAEQRSTRLTATDLSPTALAVARGNAEQLEVADRMTFVQGSLTAGASEVDLIVSNPPYIPDSERDSLMRDVRDFEPPGALFGGPDGLDVIRALLPDAGRALRPGGALCVEIGSGQADAVISLMERGGFLQVVAHHDLGGVRRVVEGTWLRPSV